MSGISLTTTGLLIFFLPYITLSQIKIEERVEIAPQCQILPNNPTQNYNFRVEVDWDAEEVQANNHFWNANLQVNTALINNCDEFVTETGFIYGWPTGSNSLELQANAYGYKILVTISGFYNSYQFVDLIFRTYLNNNLRNTFTHRVNSGNWPYYYETRTAEFGEALYLVEAFNFSIDDELIEYGCFYTVNLRTNPDGSCGSSVVASLEYDPINITIINGNEYLTLYDHRTSEEAGSTIQVMYDEFNEIDIRYINPLRDTVSKIAVIQIESNGIVETDSIEIMAAPDDLNVSIYPEQITTGEEASLDIFIDYCPPEGTKINVEIIKGQEYGNLIDPITNNKTKIITNLDHYFGYAWVDYLADSISANELDSVIIKVTTTDPGIVPKEALLIIKPPPIYVYTVPDVLGADDTADVIIKHRLEDGTLEDFPPNQTFELAVLDGCVNGNFMVGDSINVYFADALQPVKFVTADSLDEEFDKVLIRVGTDLSGFMRPIGNIKGEEEKIILEKRKGLVEDSGFRRDTLRAGFEKMMADRKAEAETKKNKIGEEPPIEAPIVTACAPDNPTYPNYWQGFASLRDDCAQDRPEGLQYIDENMYQINQLANNTNCKVNSEEDRLIGGRLKTTIHPPKLSEWGLSPRKSLLELRFTFDWNYCIDLLLQSFTKAKFIELEPIDNEYKVYNPIEDTFRKINGPGEARKIISAIMDIGIDGKIPENIEYYPLPRTKKHEFEHIDQYWDEIFINFFTALYHINQRQPPRNWCKLSEEEIGRIYDSEDEWYRTTLVHAVNETLDYMNDEVQKKLNEAHAHAVSYYYLRSVVIPGIKEQFKLP
jgi:hypothetical protein